MINSTMNIIQSVQQLIQEIYELSTRYEMRYIIKLITL